MAFCIIYCTAAGGNSSAPATVKIITSIKPSSVRRDAVGGSGGGGGGGFMDPGDLREWTMELQGKLLSVAFGECVCVCLCWCGCGCVRVEINNKSKLNVCLLDTLASFSSLLFTSLYVFLLQVVVVFLFVVVVVALLWTCPLLFYYFLLSFRFYLFIFFLVRLLSFAWLSTEKKLVKKIRPKFENSVLVFLKKSAIKNI